MLEAPVTRDYELSQFFGCYFNQDFVLDAPTPDGIIDIWKDAATPSERSRLADLIDEFIARPMSEEALEKSLFKDLGCYYNPSADRLTARQWLRHVSNRVRSE
jgi:L-rhamnose isomerase